VTSGPVDSHAKASALSDSIKRDGKTRPVILKMDPTPDSSPGQPKRRE